MANEVAKQEKPISERFMEKVISIFSSGVGEIAVTDFQKRLMQNYFMAADAALRAAEEKRKKKTKNQDPLPVIWANVDMEQLAWDAVAAARVGLDPAQKNHIALVPFKKNSIDKYGIGFIEEYRGIELKATKYGLDVPDGVVVELVYSTDTFKSFKKDRNNAIDSYEFQINNDFDRGGIIGGFYYHLFLNAPEKNKLVVMTLKDILKRKPTYASTEFWGGEKDVYVDGKKTGKKEHIEGWFEKMCYKTVYRAAYNDITIDSQKIDDDYMRLKQLEESMVEANVTHEIEENANTTPIDVESRVISESEKPTNDNSDSSDQPPADTSSSNAGEPDWADD